MVYKKLELKLKNAKRRTWRRTPPRWGIRWQRARWPFRRIGGIGTRRPCWSRWSRRSLWRASTPRTNDSHTSTNLLGRQKGTSYEKTNDATHGWYGGGHGFRYDGRCHDGNFKQQIKSLLPTTLKTHSYCSKWPAPGLLKYRPNALHPRLADDVSSWCTNVRP